MEKLKSWWRNRPEALWALVLFAISFLQFSNTLSHEYVWDDDIVIVYNSRVQQGFAGIPGHFAFRARTNFEDFTGYRPLTMTSFSLDVGLFGKNPHAAHMVNVLLFSLLVIVLFRTLRQLFPNYHAAYAFFIALLFAVHPIHVEAVANIKSRDEILALLFALLSLNAFVRHHRSGRWAWLGLSAAMLVCAALSKEGALTYLAVMPLAAIFLFEGGWKGKLISLAKYPLIVIGLALAFFALTGKPPGASTPVETTGYIETQQLGNCMAAPVETFTQGNWQRIGNSTFLFWTNVKKFFWPVDLVYFSGYDMYTIKDWTVDRVQLGSMFAGFVLVCGLSIAFARRLRELSFGWWYFCATIVIYLQLPGLLLADTVADRFMFAPSLGLCLLVVLGMARLLRLDRSANPLQSLRLRLHMAQRTRSAQWAVVGMLALITLVLTVLTFRRNAVWHDNLRLFSTDLPALDRCARAHYYYASELVRGLPQARDRAQSCREIEQHYLRAIDITPGSFYAFLRLGQHYQNEKKYSSQSALMERACKHYPDRAEIWHLRGMGLYYEGRFVDAISALREAVKRNPNFHESREFLARSQDRAKQYPEALLTLEEAMQQDNTYLFYYDVLSDTYFDMGDTASAFAPLMKLLEMDGSNPTWWRKIIGRYQLIGDNERAAYYYQQALSRGLTL